MGEVFNKIDESKAEAIYLINNAAVVTPLSSIEHGSIEELTTNFHVNLLAPILLASMFIRFSEQEEARSANKDVFAASDLFNKVKDKGMLASPTTIAEKLVDLLLSDQFAQGIVVEEL
jgi:hypothetical protein